MTTDTPEGRRTDIKTANRLQRGFLKLGNKLRAYKAKICLRLEVKKGDPSQRHDKNERLKLLTKVSWLLMPLEVTEAASERGTIQRTLGDGPIY